jgi:arylsulfatase A
MDAGIGRLLDALDRLKLCENTVVLFTSDNGPMFMGQGESDTRRYNGGFTGAKYDVLEGGIRVPAIVRWPEGLPPGRWCNDLIHFCDWMPTLLGAAGASVPSSLDLDGQDVMPMLRGEEQSLDPPSAGCRTASGFRRTPAGGRFWQWNRYTPVARCNAAMREGPWKLYHPPIPEAVRKLPSDNQDALRLRQDPGAVTDITRTPVHRRLSPPREAMLFNLQEDPREQNDLAPRHPERATAMQRELDRWFEQVEAERTAMDEETRGYPL